MDFSLLKEVSLYPLDRANESTSEKLRNMLIVLRVPMDDDSPVGYNDTFRIFAYFREGVVAYSDYAVLGK